VTVELIDSHAHISGSEYDADREQVVARARAAGVRQIVVIGSGGDVATAAAAVAMAEGDADLYATVGIHPHDAAALEASWWPQLEALARRASVVAIGETGLDYFYDTSPRPTQLQVFADFLALASTVDKPVVCHIRDAHADAIATISAADIAPERVLIHCFTGTPEEAAIYVEMGCYVALSGIVTFKGKKSDPIRDAARLIPLDRLLVETDCPYLAPTPMRGKRNEPAFVVHTTRALASELGLEFTDLARTTVANTRTFFSLTSP
jgi:TatD DNase family protein